MRWAVAAMTACAIAAVVAGPDSWLGWTALYGEPAAALLGFMAWRALHHRRSPTA